VLRALAELLFPARCVGCQRSGSVLCARCRRDLKYLDGVCHRCALPRRGWSSDCRGCARLSAALRSLRAVCAYEGAARSAVHALKYRGGRLLAESMGELMRDALRQRPLMAELVVPVPMSSRRRKERGYNHSLLLALQVAPSVGGVVAAVLERQHRQTQQGLSAAARASNIAGTVRARQQLHGERVLVIDDVATTGSTLSVCADALICAGAGTVTALVFARDL
jgi:competence protein ComFC